MTYGVLSVLGSPRGHGQNPEVDPVRHMTSGVHNKHALVPLPSHPVDLWPSPLTSAPWAL